MLKFTKNKIFVFRIPTYNHLYTIIKEGVVSKFKILKKDNLIISSHRQRY